jgi:hypothetical protein
MVADLGDKHPVISFFFFPHHHVQLIIYQVWCLSYKWAYGKSKGRVMRIEVALSFAYLANSNRQIHD